MNVLSHFKMVDDCSDINDEMDHRPRGMRVEPPVTDQTEETP